MATEYEEFFNDVPQGLRGMINHQRSDCIKRFGFAVLTESAITELKPFAPFMEVGAGNGYWSYELQKRGVECVATDPHPVGENFYKFETPWTDVEELDGVRAVRKYPNHTLLLVWPCYDKDWAYKTLRAYKGDTVVFCGEGWGGCTADDAFYELLCEEWKRVQDIDIPMWSGIHDDVAVYTRT
jgi:hypothetical protein